MDPQQQQALHTLQGIGAGFFLFIFLFAIAMVAFVIFLFWRIFTKAGMAGPLALLTLLWPIGLIVNLCILAFGEWKVVPAPNPYAGLPPYGPPGGYPPAAPPHYPPAGYPPQGPTA